MRRLPPRSHAAAQATGTGKVSEALGGCASQTATGWETVRTAGTPDVSGFVGSPGAGFASGGPVPAAVAGPAPPPAGGIGASDFFTLLTADFAGAYQVYIAAADERLAMLRFALSLLAAPFAAAIALVGAKVVPGADLASWQHLPGYLFALLAAFGVLAVLPYLRMIEASITHVRTARAMNNFRLLYARELQREFRDRSWSPNLPVDPSYPDSFAPLSWPGINAIVLAGLEASYITIGMVGLARVQPDPLLLVFGIVILTLLLFGMYYIRTNISRRRKEPANPLGFPRVET